MDMGLIHAMLEKRYLFQKHSFLVQRDEGRRRMGRRRRLVTPFLSHVEGYDLMMYLFYLNRKSFSFY